MTDEQQTVADAPTDELPIIQVDEPLGVNIVDGVAHACGISPEGDEFCLGCKRTWPCADAVRLRANALELVPEPSPEEVVAQSVATGLPWQLVADQLGVDRREVQAFLDAGTSN